VIEVGRNAIAISSDAPYAMVVTVLSTLALGPYHLMVPGSFQHLLTMMRYAESDSHRPISFPIWLVTRTKLSLLTYGLNGCSGAA